jgi:hypothetical protein
LSYTSKRKRDNEKNTDLFFDHSSSIIRFVFQSINAFEIEHHDRSQDRASGCCPVALRLWRKVFSSHIAGPGIQKRYGANIQTLRRPPPELAVEIPFTDYLITRAGGKEQLTRFIEELKDFSRQTDFMTFFREHEDFYYKTIQNIEENFIGMDFVGVLEKYFADFGGFKVFSG